MEAHDDPWTCSVVPQHYNDHASDSEEQINDARQRRTFNGPLDYRVQHLNQDMLIHRHPIIKEEHAATRNYGNAYSRPKQHQQQHKPLLRKSKLRRNINISWTKIALACSVVIFYAVIMLRGSHLLQHERTHDFPPGSRTAAFLAREQLAQNRWLTRLASTGQSRTRPTATNVQELEPYEFALMDQEPRRQIHTDDKETSFLPAESICGDYARNAAKIHPNSFQARDALSVESRVLITGILNPIGYLLAMTLKQKCGVEVIAGIDTMFPNTVANRMAMQERIQLLVTNIPKLVQPVVLPLVGLDPRLNKDKENTLEILPMTGEISLLNMKPTHIIHLASYVPIEKGPFLNTQSPYGGHSDMYQTRSNAVAMEHILHSLVNTDAERPHFSYASSVTVSHDHLADEILADTYYNLNRTFSVGVRLPSAVFGPWSHPTAPVYKLAEAAIQQWGGTPDTLLNQTDGTYDFSFVDDIIEGIIAAMQYRSPTPIVFDFSSDSTHKLSTVANVIKDLMPGAQIANSNIQSELIPIAPLVQRTRDLLQWKPTTSLQTGLVKTMAWHLDRAFPFGGNSTETGDAFRNRLALDTCSANDVLCHLGPAYLPCVSECSTRTKCKPSIFDSIHSVVRDVSQECDIVLYTQSLGYNVRDLKLHAIYNDADEIMICNFAFVPKSSRLVHEAVEKVPADQLQVFGLDTATGEQGFHEKKLTALNGRLLYKGWILLWVDDALDNFPIMDRSLLKLAPGSFFSPDVKHALFVDENFAISPSTEDVLFLVSQSHRPNMPARAAWRKEEDGKKHKYRLPAEPERRAALMVSPLRKCKPLDPKSDKTSHSLTVYEATKCIQAENGEDLDAKETQGVKRQREFYERVPTFVNRVDMRSPDEPWYRYELSMWIRSKWIVHDLRLGEAKRLRCEWYQEHVQWGNTLEQLSFAHVMAKRELERRMAHVEPDDHIKPAFMQHPELLQLTDSHEWHAMESEENRLAHIHPMDALAKVPDSLIDEDELEEADATEQVMPVMDEGTPKKIGEAVPLFVRIISERVMMLERQSWSAAYAKYKAEKKKKKKK